VVVAANQYEEDTDVAFIGDGNFVLSYALTPCVSLYAGYYLLFVDGLALAPEQFNVAQNEVDHSGFVLFQGVLGGVEVTF